MPINWNNFFLFFSCLQQRVCTCTLYRYVYFFLPSTIFSENIVHTHTHYLCLHRHTGQVKRGKDKSQQHEGGGLFCWASSRWIGKEKRGRTVKKAPGRRLVGVRKKKKKEGPFCWNGDFGVKSRKSKWKSTDTEICDLQLKRYWLLTTRLYSDKYWHDLVSQQKSIPLPFTDVCVATQKRKSLCFVRSSSLEKLFKKKEFISFVSLFFLLCCSVLSMHFFLNCPIT